MSRNSSGTYTLPSAAFVPGTTISSSAVNSNFSDIGTALTQSLATTGVSTMTGPIKASNGSVGLPAYTWGSSQTDGFYQIAAGNIGLALGGALFASWGPTANGAIQVGTVLQFAGATRPAGWLFCLGQAVSRTTYASLFTALGTTYGSGDGSTTFNVPDCRGRTAYGLDNGAARITVAGGNMDGTVLGNTGGQQNVTLTVSQIPAHTHGYSGTTGTENQNFNHNYSGTTSTENANHAHPGNGFNFVGQSPSGGSLGGGGSNGPTMTATGAQNATHAHTYTGTTGTENQVHNHNYSGNTDNGTGGGASHPVLSNAIIMNFIIYTGIA
jgi:microcystin-dependent protein